MWSFVKNLFTVSNDNSTKVIDGILAAGDKLVLTEEERLDFQMKGRELFLKQLELERESQGIRSVTRRWIAIMVMTHYFLWINVALVSFFFGLEAFAKFAFDLVLEVFWLVFAVASFYFGPAVADYVGKRFGKGPQ